MTVAEKKGGIVNIVSTKEYRSQMPAVIIGNKKWMQANRAIVEGLLAATFEGADKVKASDDALKQAAAISALVYKEQDAAYWYKYYKGVTQKDAKGIDVDLGGSTVSNLPDNLQLFGMSPGSINAFASTYTVFGNVVKSQYPALVPSFYPADQITDTSYLKDVAAKAPAGTTTADNPSFTAAQKVSNVVSRRSWDIPFESGNANFTPAASKDLQSLLNDLVVASGTIVEVQGHTDNTGTPEANMALSESRAFAVKSWLEKQAPSSFPEGRIRVTAKGQTEPVAPNSTPDGKAKNRRVVVILGTST